jgi:APA family basic amino acid/polyamine antiporter
VVIGLGAMIGAGIFAALAPAATAAGRWLPAGLMVAGAVAYANATSSAQLAAAHPEAGGTYAYGRHRLGPFWGYLAGWGFVVGKTASCAAMALTVGAYAWPRHARAVALAAVVVLAAVNYRGVERTARTTRVIVVAVLATLAFVVVASLAGGAADIARLDPTATVPSARGILQAAGLLFFAFAGYARIATLGEEVVDPQHTIPRAIPLALGITLVVYAVVAAAAIAALGAQRLGAATAPLAEAVAAGRFAAAVPAVRAGATLAALGVLLSLLAGVSRTAFAMARNGELPRALAAVHPRFGIPHRAEVVVAGAVVVLVAFAELGEAIGFSAFAVLVYYAIANAAALRLSPQERRWPRWLAAGGLGGCLLLASTLPPRSVLAGAGVLAAGAAVYAVRALAARRGGSS